MKYVQSGALTGLVGGLLFVMACGPDSTPPPPSVRSVGIPVVVKAVRAKDLSSSASKVAVIRADKEQTLNFSLPGNLGEYLVEEGTRLDVGDPVARLDVAPFRSRLAEARIQLQELERQRDRVERFYSRRLATQVEYDQIRALHDQAVENVNALRESLEKAVLRSPVAGLVTELNSAPGEFLQPGTPVVTVVSSDRLVADLEFTDTERGAIPLGEDVTFAVDGLPGKTFSGRLSSRTPQVDPRTQLTIVELQIDDSDGLLQPGMMLTAEIELETRRRVVTVPVETVVFDGDEICVFVHDADRSEAERRLVTLGDFFETRVVIERGLQAGEPLIVAGHGFLSDRTTVRIVDEAVIPPGMGGAVDDAGPIERRR